MSTNQQAVIANGLATLQQQGQSAERFETALAELSYKMENIANHICRAQYDDTVTSAQLADMEAEFDRLHEQANTLVKAVMQEETR